MKGTQEELKARTRPGLATVNAGHRSATRRPIGKISAKCCSFSAVSAPIFARKYAFSSSLQNLQDHQTEVLEILQNLANFATFANFLLNFHKIADFQTDFAKFLRMQRCKSMQIL